MRRLLLLLAVLALGACASTPQPPPFDPVGTYSFATQAQGTTIPGTLTVRRADGGLRAVLTTGMTPAMAIDSVVLEGRKLFLRQALDMGELAMELEFAEDDRFTGSWSLGGAMSGTVSGTRQPPQGQSR